MRPRTCAIAGWRWSSGRSNGRGRGDAGRASTSATRTAHCSSSSATISRRPNGRLPMSKTIELLEKRQVRKGRPRFKAGDTVRVHFQVIEGQRRRIQVFEGIVIKRQGAGVRETFTVRKQSFGVGVERTSPLHSPKIEKIEVKIGRASCRERV